LSRERVESKAKREKKGLPMAAAANAATRDRS